MKLRIQIKQTYLVIGALLGWTAVILQLYLIIINRVASVPETIIRFFSFYTILTNILVAVCFTILFFPQKTTKGNFFSRQKTLAATAVYITIVGLVYNLVLRFIWEPKGVQLVVDELLHSITPVLFVVYWLAFIPKKELEWIDALYWLIYPLVYIIYILFRGALSGFYPYPFINVSDIGYIKTFMNSSILTLVFLFFSLLYIAISKYITKASIKV